MTNYYKISNKFLSKRDTLLLAIENAGESKHIPKLPTRLFNIGNTRPVFPTTMPLC